MLFSALHRWDENGKYLDEQFPGGNKTAAENYCRNPSGDRADGPWCYTERSDVYFRYCDIPYCGEY